MEMIDFIVWVYGISREEAILQILSLRAGGAEKLTYANLHPKAFRTALRATGGKK